MSGPVTHEAIMERLEAGNDRFRKLEEQHAQIIGQQVAILELLEPIPQIKADITAANETAQEVKEIVSAWSTVKNVGRFAKWVGPVAIMLAALVLWGRWALSAIVRALN